MVITPLAFVLFHAWPLAIGVVSLFYCGKCPGLPSHWCPVSLVTVTNIYVFYKRELQFRRLMSSTPGLTHSRYIRLMLVSTTEILGTIPLATFYLVLDAKLGVKPYSWMSTHRHYSEVIQVPASIWKNDLNSALSIEMYRWSLVLCAFLFFAFFGFAGEARRNYCRMYASITSRIRHWTSALHGLSHVCVVHSIVEYIETDGCSNLSSFSTPSPPHVGRNGGVAVCVAKTAEEKQDSSVSPTDQSSILSISNSSGLERPDFEVEQNSPSNTVTPSSVERIDESETQDLSALPAVTMPTVPSATLPPHFPETTRSTLRAYSSFDAV